MLLNDIPKNNDELRLLMDKLYRQDEDTCVKALLEQPTLNDHQLYTTEQRALKLIAGVRARRKKQGGLDAFLMEYDLSSEEGVALMCLAEALLRIPDTETINKLIVDKIAQGKWEEHQGESESIFVNAMTWGLMLTGKMLSTQKTSPSHLFGSLRQLITRSGMPAIRLAINRMMKIMSQQFVMGQTIESAIKRAKTNEAMGYRYSYDMLGEAARTQADAERYFQAYQQAIEKIARVANSSDPRENPGISIKLSALHPRYEATQYQRVLKELTPKVLMLAQLAAKANINLTVDAEEADRLDLSLDIIEKIVLDPSLKHWQGFGLAVQSYQKRAPYVLDWLIQLAQRAQKRLMIRLIKGAYWDSEIKRAQVGGFAGYPVFTRKIATDVSFLVCAKKILNHTDVIFPQFATHNAYSLSAILAMAGKYRDFEFQCLHGMGQPLYDQVVGREQENIPCRIYAPVGGYQDLLAYLVRRLLENGANTSFVNRIVDENSPLQSLIASPVKQLELMTHKAHPRIPLPRHLFGNERLNSRGFDSSNRSELYSLQQKLTDFTEKKWQAESFIYQQRAPGEKFPVYSPFQLDSCLGEVSFSQKFEIDGAFLEAKKAFDHWSHTPVSERVGYLHTLANLLEEHLPELLALTIREAGKTLADGISEVREAIDFCRYYGSEAEKQLSQPRLMPGPTGEFNALSLQGRGIIVCISPWNFPLAIFLGQITAALVTGNCVIAKPAEQTSLIAYRAVQLAYEAGIPKNVLQLLLGDGETIGHELIAHPDVSGAMFTGSTQVAKAINLTLAKKPGAIVPFIAETGGQNVMIADSTALPEQLVMDVITSAFISAGQRCSALRVLYLQQEIADKVIHMLQGAMAELVVGDPSFYRTDIGPVIDKAALNNLQNHLANIQQHAKLIYQTPLHRELTAGYFFAPTIVEINSISELTHEVFGPFLHIIRFDHRNLDNIIAEINQTGFGLTFGVQSRIYHAVNYLSQRVHAGNCYVNRNMIGAVVGVQAFGGEGLSGTGPKAGGPHYLSRLCVERMLTIDTTASGGNASLLSLGDED
ncbi:MAG: bifunctional proline dehydrogenase/L-glutamate gamma-semialdehyde dehydrogenase PutA [Legionellales bacterium]|nr:bifunctional proline dehydrogenase/L-glutamate gamma-semialdehyde dehydrogenase PutA [Legionellales bacterium]